MENETEKLLQKWLKLQILQYKFSFIKTIIMISLFLFGAWFFYFNLMPKLEKQLESTQLMLEKLSNVSQDFEDKQNLLEQIQNQFKNPLQ